MIEQIDSMIHQLRAMQVQLRSTTPPVLPSIQEEEAAGICHYCKESLGGEKPVRGDHPRCYKEIMRGIAANELTEVEALEKGWMAPPKPAGRKPNASPLKSFAAEKEAKQRKVAEDIEKFNKERAKRKGTSE